jgi:hypothetical protein
MILLLLYSGRLMRLDLRELLIFFMPLSSPTNIIRSYYFLRYNSFEMEDLLLIGSSRLWREGSKSYLSFLDLVASSALDEDLRMF